jgi:uncharacterized phage infection (PIP) family protein YhgE
MQNPLKKTATTLSKRTSTILDAFNKTLNALDKVQQEVDKRNNQLANEILEREIEQKELREISEKNSKITTNFKKLIEG